MSKHLWGTVYSLRPAESSPGEGIAQDYFGFYVESNRSSPNANTTLGRDAEELAERRERERLNEGKPFSGFVAKCHVAHVRLLVGRHLRHGLCAYVDELTSHANNKIEILSEGTKIRTIVARNEFFDNLLNEELSASDIEAVCRAYHRVHVQMDRS
jgi:hypothetical protein